MKSEEKKDLITFLIIVFIGIVFLFFFKIKHSMTFLNLDEILWMYRSRFFLDNVLNFNFSSLIQSSQPGIMVMWIEGPFMKMINYDFYALVSLIKNLNNSGIGYNFINSHNQIFYYNYKNISFLFNIPILAIVFLFLFSLRYLLQKLLFNKWAIVFSLFLIVTTPYYIYFTTPTDKFVGIFSILSFLSLLVFLSKKGGKKFLIFSAILGSWAVLTKLSALFLLPFFFFAFVFYKIEFNWRSYNFLSCCKLKISSLKEIIKNYLIWLIVFFITAIIFLPTIISNPKSVLNLIVREKTIRTVNHDFVFNSNIVFAYLTDSFLLCFNIFIIFLFFSFIGLIIWRIKNRIKVNKEVLLLIIYIFLFFIFVIKFSKIYSFRYLVPALIPFQIVAGLGAYEFANIFIRQNNIINKKLVYYWVIILILISQGLLIYYIELETIEQLPL